MFLSLHMNWIPIRFYAIVAFDGNYETDICFAYPSSILIATPWIYALHTYMH